MANCDPENLEQAEQLATQIAQAAGAAVVEQLLPTLAGAKSYRGSRLPCGNGHRAKFVGYRKRGVGTLYGVVDVSRAYYHCRHCHQGFSPWDKEQGLDERLWTAHVKALVVQVSARLPFRESVDLLHTTLGFRIEDSSADELMREVGGRLRAEQAALMAGIDSGELTPLVTRAPRRLYVGMDGTSAHIDGSWHEVKMGVIYEGGRGQRWHRRSASDDVRGGPGAGGAVRLAAVHDRRAGGGAGGRKRRW